MKGVRDPALDVKIVEYIRSVNEKSPPYFPTISDIAKYLRKNPYTIRYRLLSLVKNGKLAKTEEKQPGRDGKRIGYSVTNTKDNICDINYMTQSGHDFKLIRFNDENPCECSACGKTTASGVRIHINTILHIYDLKILVFCNECWIPPEVEALLCTGKRTELEKLTN
jgi:hypothetical protein